MSLFHFKNSSVLALITLVFTSSAFAATDYAACSQYFSESPAADKNLFSLTSDGKIIPTYLGSKNLKTSTDAAGVSEAVIKGEERFTGRRRAKRIMDGMLQPFERYETPEYHIRSDKQGRVTSIEKFVTRRGTGVGPGYAWLNQAIEFSVDSNHCLPKRFVEARPKEAVLAGPDGSRKITEDRQVLFDLQTCKDLTKVYELTPSLKTCDENEQRTRCQGPLGNRVLEQIFIETASRNPDYKSLDIWDFAKKSEPGQRDFTAKAAIVYREQCATGPAQLAIGAAKLWNWKPSGSQSAGSSDVAAATQAE